MMRAHPCLLVSAMALVLCASVEARAVSCDAIPSPIEGEPSAPVVYVEGANAVGPFLVPLQQALSTDPNPITLIYIGDGGCLGASNFFTNLPISVKPKPIYYSAQVQGTCDLPSSAPVADIAASDVYAPSCGTLPGGQLPPHIGDFLGPIQPLVFVVPKASSQLALSASAAYMTFGFGADSGVAPWTNAASIYRRNKASAVQALMSVAIGVPITRWAGVDAAALPGNVSAGLSGAAAVINSLELDPNPEQAIGILADTNIDAATASHLRILAYKDNQQTCGFSPDSTIAAHDKANVRDGHYSLWGPLHFFTYVDDRGVPQNPLVQRIMSYLIGTAMAPGGVDLIQIEGV